MVRVLFHQSILIGFPLPSTVICLRLLGKKLEYAFFIFILFYEFSSALEKIQNCLCKLSLGEMYDCFVLKVQHSDKHVDHV